MNNSDHDPQHEELELQEDEFEERPDGRDNDDMTVESEENTVQENESTNVDSDDSEEDYFDDDEEMLLGDDKVIFSEDDRAAFMQLENSIVWRIDGLYNAKGEVKNKFALKQNPPELTVISSDGDDESFATFFLTPEVCKTLSEALDTTYRAYYGVKKKKSQPFSQASIRESYENSVQWIKDHPVKMTISVLVIVFIVVFGFIL